VRTKTVQDPGASYRELKSRESVWVKSGPDMDQVLPLSEHVDYIQNFPGKVTWVSSVITFIIYPECGQHVTIFVEYIFNVVLSNVFNTLFWMYRNSSISGRFIG